MNTKLYVGNLDYSITGEQLEKLFSEYGTVVEAVVISDKYSGRSKGFGFVTMSKPEEAEKAVKGLNGKDHEGRNLVVNEARPREPREAGSGGRN